MMASSIPGFPWVAVGPNVKYLPDPPDTNPGKFFIQSHLKCLNIFTWCFHLISEHSSGAAASWALAQTVGKAHM